MLHKTYLKRLYTKLLREAAEESQAGDKIINPFSDNDIGFYQDDEAPDVKEGIAYKCKDLIEIISNNTPIDEDDFWKLCVKSTIGFIRIIESKEPCYGAWEVTRSAGPGYGKLVYAMGYHMSPTGKLMPDRTSVSDSAREAWRKANKKSKGLKFDDVNNPKTSDPSDDCVIHYPPNKIFKSYDDKKRSAVTKKTSDTGDKSKKFIANKEKLDAINRAYQLGDMGYDFTQMSNNHENVIKYAQQQFKVPKDQLNKNIKWAGQALFQKYYGLSPTTSGHIDHHSCARGHLRARPRPRAREFLVASAGATSYTQKWCGVGVRN